MEEGRSDMEFSKSSGLDLKLISTQPSLEVEVEVEDHCGTAMACHALKTQRYHLVAFTGVSSGSVSNGDGSPSESILRH
jgi:hypothetical protein